MSNDAAHALLSHPRYQAIEVLGRGAQGTVLRVVDTEAPARRLVAKVWQSGAFAKDQLEGEFALLARLRIPGLVRAHDFGRTGGAPFFVEDYVEGDDAVGWLRDAEPRERNTRLLRLLADVAATLGALHEAGFLHGDLKPEHVRIPSGGRAVVLDLGAAVLHGRVRAAGITRTYAAPELLAGGASSPASDLYGLGALAWAATTGKPRERAGMHLRDVAPWVTPSVADVIESLLAAHPADRPRDALEVLSRLGQGNAIGAWEGSRGPPTGREAELAILLNGFASANSGNHVRYVVGASGAGKSHLLRELVTSTLLGGREARRVRFPCDQPALVARLVAFLRGADDAWPYLTEAAKDPVLLALDDLHLAPAELVFALEAYRCRANERPRADVVATAREARAGANVLMLGALGDAHFAALCREIGIDDPAQIALLARESAGAPGWLLASRGRVPLTRDAILERTRGLSAHAKDALAAMALMGGEMTERVLLGMHGDETDAVLDELFAASLVTRRTSENGATYSLTSRHLAVDVAAAMADYAVTDRAAAALLADVEASATMLLTTANAPCVPKERTELLRRCATRARLEGLRSEEIESLLTLAAEPRERTAVLLKRLERLTRDTGTAAAHPQVLTWLDEAARTDARVLPLALRSRAEKAARAGETEVARGIAKEARDAAGRLGDPEAEAFTLATTGVVALYRADWAEAERVLSEARAMTLTFEANDPEQLARLDHNLGVVALYRAKHEKARECFERSLSLKRALGDLSGVASCLLNLALTLSGTARFDEADRALDEAILLARTLKNAIVLGWCLAARADLAVKRGHAALADRWTTEAEAMGDALPAKVRADLAILRAEIALLEGNGPSAIRALGAMNEATRKGDALIDARAMVLTARAHLAILPVDRRLAARVAIAAARRARAAALPEPEAQALAVLRAARAKAGRTGVLSKPTVIMSEPSLHDAPLWHWIASLAEGGEGCHASNEALGLAKLLVSHAKAERGFVALADGEGNLTSAWGADLDGLAIAEAERRIPEDLVRLALAREGAVYLRETETAAGAGSRLAIASPATAKARAVIVLEHRFVVGRFDHVSAPVVERWAALAGLVARLSGQRRSEPPESQRAETSAPPSSMSAFAASTSIPLQEARRAFPTILGTSPALRRALARLDAAIDSDLPLLITGETGVGKEIFARAVHDFGKRSARPFVAVNCAAIPDALFEAELFGHARGSFTGADRARAGLFARAQGGTLLLDEIGELPLQRQAGLLRALESRRYRPVGSDEEQSFDVRIVAATNRELERAVREGGFRQDLLFRLQVLEVHIPALRERDGDIPLLARSFLDRANSPAEITARAMAALVAYPWPGNIRELEHQMMRLAALGGAQIDLEHLPREVRQSTGKAARTPKAPDERADVARALAATTGNISRAATMLGLTRHGLKKRMLRLGMRAPAGGIKK